jgi:RHS repeat-associated protein
MGAIKANYIYGIGLISRIDSAGQILYYHFNAEHNTIALSNSSGTVTDTFTYEPFGVMLDHRGTTQQPYTFMGQYGIEQETPGLYYMRARYYDAANHRFLIKDPYPATLADPQTLNKYAYGLNNPLSNIDPTGLCVEGSQTDWDIYRAQHPITAGIVNGFGNFVTGTVEGIGNIIFHPINTAKAIVTTAIGFEGMMLNQAGIHNQIGQNFENSINAAINTTVNNFINGDAYTKSSMISEGVFTIGSFFVGGEVAEVGNAERYSIYVGTDINGEIKYAGITSRDPNIRFMEHANSGTERALLDYKVVNSANSEIDARIIEQKLINEHGLDNLFNKINSIAEKNWYLYGIKK